jgi:hypothetical protein
VDCEYARMFRENEKAKGIKYNGCNIEFKSDRNVKGAKMMYKELVLTKLLTLVIIVEALILSVMADGTVSGEKVKGVLSGGDKDSNLADYKVSFVVTRTDNPFNDPNQGIVFEDCEATWTPKGDFAMKIVRHYEHPPVFGVVGSHDYLPVDYDNKENLIAWRTIQEYVLCTSNRNDSVSECEAFTVAPDGKLTKKGTNIIFTQFPVDKPYTGYQFRYYRLPMGRGYSSQLTTIGTVESLPSGFLKLQSSGSCGSGFQGRWDVTVDPNADYLVREAFFTRDGESKPMEVVTTNGIMKQNGIVFAKNGTYKSISGFELSVEVTALSKMNGGNTFYNEVVSELNKKLPHGASIVDMRGDKTIRKTVE